LPDEGSERAERSARVFCERINRSLGALPYFGWTGIYTNDVSRYAHPPPQGARRMGRTAFHDPRHRTRTPCHQTLGCHPEERAFCATKDPGVPREHSRAVCENAKARGWHASKEISSSTPEDASSASRSSAPARSDGTPTGATSTQTDAPTALTRSTSSPPTSSRKTPGTSSQSAQRMASPKSS